jgi:hypothetical protein
MSGRDRRDGNHARVVALAEQLEDDVRSSREIETRPGRRTVEFGRTAHPEE